MKKKRKFLVSQGNSLWDEHKSFMVMTVLFQKEKIRSVKAVKGEWGDWYLCDGVFREIFVDGIIDLTVYSKDSPWTGSG